jgi:hypothetical protein
MASADLPKVFCYKENAFFPASDFIDDPKLGRIHNVDPPHIDTGTRLERSGEGFVLIAKKVSGVLGDEEDD